MRQMVFLQQLRCDAGAQGVPRGSFGPHPPGGELTLVHPHARGEGGALSLGGTVHLAPGNVIAVGSMEAHLRQGGADAPETCLKRHEKWPHTKGGPKPQMAVNAA